MSSYTLTTVRNIVISIANQCCVTKYIAIHYKLLIETVIIIGVAIVCTENVHIKNCLKTIHCA